MDDQWKTLRDVATELCVSEATIRREVVAGKLRHTRIGKQYRVRQSWVDAYIECRSNTVTSVTGCP